MCTVLDSQLNGEGGGRGRGVLISAFAVPHLGTKEGKWILLCKAAWAYVILCLHIKRSTPVRILPFPQCIVQWQGTTSWAYWLSTTQLNAVRVNNRSVEYDYIFTLSKSCTYLLCIHYTRLGRYGPVLFKLYIFIYAILMLVEGHSKWERTVDRNGAKKHSRQFFSPFIV